MRRNMMRYHVEWAPNEKVGVEVAVGASIGGVRSLSCMKHVGLNVAADPFFTAAYTGVTGGAVILVADDNGCHSSQNEQDSRYYGRSAGVPVLEPSNAQECKDYLKLAYEISEKVRYGGSDPFQHEEYHIPEVSLSWAKEPRKIVSRMKRTSRSTWQCRRWRRKLHIAQEQRMDQNRRRTRRTSLSA